MEYVVGPILALLLGMKFTHFTTEKMKKDAQTEREMIAKVINERIVENNTQMSQQTLKMMMPMARASPQSTSNWDCERKGGKGTGIR